MEQIKTKIQKEIENLTGEVSVAQAEYLRSQNDFERKKDELVKLKAALAALDGASALSVVPTSLIPTILSTPLNGTPIESRIEVVDGVKYEVPEGFEISKNSFGEVAIVPVGTQLPPMAEPTKPAANALESLPTGDETFDSPEDLL